MPKPAESLAELQTQFLALLYEDTAAPEGIVRSDALPAARRLDIYRNNLRGNFHKVLALEFPVIQQLCGADFFEQLAAEFQRAQPSRHANLHHIGAGFAGWLGTRMQGSGYEWFSAVAQLEWAWQECYVAPEPATIADFSALASLGEEQQEQLRFRLSPAARLLRSAWPVLSIWQAHQEDAERSGSVRLEDIDLARGESLLVLRQPRGVTLHSLTGGEAALLESLAAGHPLGEALETAVAQDAALDIGAALQRAATLNVFCEILIRR